MAVVIGAVERASEWVKAGVGSGFADCLRNEACLVSLLFSSPYRCLSPPLQKVALIYAEMRHSAEPPHPLHPPPNIPPPSTPPHIFLPNLEWARQEEMRGMGQKSKAEE